MRVFVTGGTGFIGSVVVEELISAGHKVVGLARSDTAEEQLKSVGAEVIRGSLNDLEILKRGAKHSDGVIHCAFILDFSDLDNSIKTDYAVIQAIGSALEGTNRPFINTSGTLGLPQGKLALEKDGADPASVFSARCVTNEEAALSFASKAVRASVIRLAPTIHGKGDKAFIPALINLARQKGESAYIGDGGSRWPAAHLIDIARLYRLVLEKGKAGAVYHGVAEEGIPTREIAEVIGKHLGVPIVSKSSNEAVAHFGFLGIPFGIDNIVSSDHTQQELGWHPVQASLLSDIDQNYF